MMNHFIIYHTEDGNSKINLTLENGTIWLTQLQIVELFQTSKQTISELIKNILEDGELDEKVVVNYQYTATNQGEIEDGLPKRKVASYNLDMILAIGYRVQSPRGIQFRKYASTALKEYFIKGFVMDDELIKNLGRNNYFEDILERIRDIRFSRKVFYRQLLDLFATSVDYNKDSGEAKQFFVTILNKLHFPIHHQTTTESGNNEGIKIVKVELPTYSEFKRYLTEKELASFDQLVSECLDIAEKQVKQKFTMTMKDWNYRIEQLLSKIDDDIEFSEKY
ncbi:RhuM family protein [Granulicatella sp.]